MGPRSTGGASPARPEGQRGRQHTEGLGRSRVQAPALTPPLVQSPRWRLRAALDVALRGAGRASPSRAGCNKHAPCHQARPALLCLPTCLCCLSRRLPPAATLPRSGLSPVPALLGRSRAGCEQPPGFFQRQPGGAGTSCPTVRRADVLRVCPAACSWRAGHSPGLPSQRLAGALLAFLTLGGGQG